MWEEPDKVFIKDAENFQTPSPQIIKRHKSYLSAFKTVLQYPADDSDEDVTQNMYDLSIQELEPLTTENATNTDYITVTDVSDDLEELLSILPNAINSLKDAGMYTEWINYIRMLGSNEFPLKNIAHLLFLDVCRWYQYGNTVSMRYSPEIKHFWLLGYKLFQEK